MKSFGSKRKARVIKVDDPDEKESAPEAPTKEAEPTGKSPALIELSLREKPDADFGWGGH